MKKAWGTVLMAAVSMTLIAGCATKTEEPVEAPVVEEVPQQEVAEAPLEEIITDQVEEG